MAGGNFRIRNGPVIARNTPGLGPQMTEIIFTPFNDQFTVVSASMPQGLSQFTID
jgi:hypothetical protein